MLEKKALRAVAMNHEIAREISEWTYDEPYGMYSLEPSLETIQELLNGFYVAVFLQTEVIGFYCTREAAQVPSGRAVGVYSGAFLDIGLGMKPIWTGKGYGRGFFAFVEEEVRKSEPNACLRLTVADWNKRAARLYKSFRFIEVARFSREQGDFLVMEQMKKA